MYTVLVVDKQSEFAWKYWKILELVERELFSRYSSITVIMGSMSVSFSAQGSHCGFWLPAFAISGK